MSSSSDRSRIRQQVNSELAARSLARGGGVAFHRPIHVYLQVASACNLDCYMCSEHNRPEEERHGRGLRSMSPELFAKIEREVFPWSSRTYIGVGGEPTIVPHFADFVRRAGLAGQEIHLVTNGTRFEHGEIAQVVADHVTQLFVSLDAATAPTYERIRRGSRWDRVIRGMLRLREFRESSTTGKCRLTLSFVLMRSNVRELPDFVELARELGADAVHAQHVIPVNEEGRVEMLCDEMELYQDVRAEAQRRADALGIELDAPLPFAGQAEVPPAAAIPFLDVGAAPVDVHPVRVLPVTVPPVLAAESVVAAAEPPALDPPPQDPPPDPPRRATSARTGPAIPCQFPSTSFVVLYDGRVYPCCHPFAHQKLQIGDLNTQSMAEIWNDRIVRNLRIGMRNGDVPETCRNCSIAHDPPPGREDPVVLASSLDLSAYYDGRDLETAGERPVVDATPHGRIEGTGALEYIEDLRTHSNSLEAEVLELRKHAAALEDVGGHRNRHIANLERDMADMRSRWTLRQRIVSRLRRWTGGAPPGPDGGRNGS